MNVLLCPGVHSTVHVFIIFLIYPIYGMFAMQQWGEGIYKKKKQSWENALRCSRRCDGVDSQTSVLLSFSVFF